MSLLKPLNRSRGIYLIPFQFVFWIVINFELLDNLDLMMSVSFSPLKLNQQNKIRF